MNKQGKGKIEWCDFTWSPITGCRNGCSWCYARRMYQRFKWSFEPMFHPDRLNEPFRIKKPSSIFADSVSDFWSVGVKQEWREKVYAVMRETPQHTYFVLTKRPDRITKQDRDGIPSNCLVGVSVCDFDDRYRIKQLIANTREKTKRFVSVEPILSDVITDYIYCVDWIILGGLTGKRNPFRPKKTVIDEIVMTARRLKIPLFIKNNLGYKPLIQETVVGEK